MQSHFSTRLPGSVPRLYGAYPEIGGLVIFMEATKSSLLPLCGMLDEDAVRYVVKQLMLRVHLLQLDGAKHGDIKPANIFVTEDAQVMMGDLGCGEWTGENGQWSIICRTPGYWAPEIDDQDSVFPITWRADIHSIGVVMTDLKDDCSNFSDEARNLAFDMQEENPEDRPMWENAHFQRWAGVHGEEVENARAGKWDDPPPSFVDAVERYLKGLF